MVFSLNLQYILRTHVYVYNASFIVLCCILRRTQRILKAGSAKKSGAAKVIQIIESDLEKTKRGETMGVYQYACTCNCSTMGGRIKGTDSAIYSILRMVGIYRTGEEFIELEAVRKHIPIPSLAFYDRFSCYKPVKTPSLMQYGNCRTRGVVEMR